MNYRWFVGIDVSKEKLDVCLFDSQSKTTDCFETGNNQTGHQRLLDRLCRRQAERSQTVLCLENTGLYDDLLLQYVHTRGWTVSVGKTTIREAVRPEHHRKEDEFDSRLVSEYAYRFHDKLEAYQPPDPIIEELRALYRERRRLVTQQRALIQLLKEAHLRTHPTELLVDSWQRRRAFNNQEIKALERRMLELVNADPQIQRRFDQMRGIDGFGNVTALMWVVRFFGQKRLNPRRIASRWGHAPHSKQSGKKKAPNKSSGFGDSEARKMMTMCARSAGHHKPKYRAYKAKKLAQGKPGKLVTNNIINKLIRVACAVWNQDSQFNPNYRSPFEKNTLAA